MSVAIKLEGEREKRFPPLQQRDNLLYYKRIMVLEDLGSQTSSGSNMDTQSSQNRSTPL